MSADRWRWRRSFVAGVERPSEVVVIGAVGRQVGSWGDAKHREQLGVRQCAGRAGRADLHDGGADGVGGIRIAHGQRAAAEAGVGLTERRRGAVAGAEAEGPMREKGCGAIVTEALSPMVAKTLYEHGTVSFR
jgi:hypothetical protein